MSDKNTDRVLDLILSQLEKLNENQERLSEEIQKTNIELTKLTGVKHAITHLREWKENIEKSVNAYDLSKIKEFYTKHQDINSDIEDIYVIIKELRESSDDYKKFKIRGMTIVAVITFLVTSAMTALTLLSRWWKS